MSKFKLFSEIDKKLSMNPHIDSDLLISSRVNRDKLVHVFANTGLSQV